MTCDCSFAASTSANCCSSFEAAAAAPPQPQPQPQQATALAPVGIATSDMDPHDSAPPPLKPHLPRTASARIGQDQHGPTRQRPATVQTASATLCQRPHGPRPAWPHTTAPRYRPIRICHAQPAPALAKTNTFIHASRDANDLQTAAYVAAWQAGLG